MEPRQISPEIRKCRREYMKLHVKVFKCRLITELNVCDNFVSACEQVIVGNF